MIACIIIKWFFFPKFLLCLWICTCVFVIKEKYILLCHRFVFCPVVHLAHTVVFCFHFLTLSKYIFLAFLIFCCMLNIRRSLFLYLSFLPLLHQSFILSLSLTHAIHFSSHSDTSVTTNNRSLSHITFTQHYDESPMPQTSPTCGDLAGGTGRTQRLQLLQSRFFSSTGPRVVSTAKNVESIWCVNYNSKTLSP